jgi:hypothetical protein
VAVKSPTDKPALAPQTRKNTTAATSGKASKIPEFK